MGVGYMLSEGIIAVIYIMGSLFGMMLSFYVLLLLIQWVADVIEEKRWKDWRYWFNG